jgi:phosphoglycerol transferase MdoB-like AlkP superfamily enzyme
MNTMIDYLKGAFTYLLVMFLIVTLYTELSHYWSTIGGVRGDLVKFEIPLVLLLLFIFYFPTINNRIIRYLFPVVPVLVLYLSVDIFYGFLGRSPRPSDFQNINMVSDFSVGLMFLIFFLGFLICFPVVMLFYKAYQNRSFKDIIYSVLFRVLSVSLVLFVFLSDTFADYRASSYQYTEWSQEKSIKENGRFSSFIFYGYQEKKNFSLLNEYGKKNIDIKEILFPNIVRHPRNIHIVVLESFIDPRLLLNINFNRSPLANELISYLLPASYNFSHVISPVYGGNTAQAEFELLTGIHAFAKIGSAEFNILQGGKANGFVGVLNQHGYKSIATLATGSGYYNSVLAYKSLGFDDVLFLAESGIITDKEKERGVSDAGVLKHSLSRIKNALNTATQPIVSYTLGMYGHFPYERDLSDEPDIINSDHQDERVKRISNQFYYRTKAVADFIKQLTAIDSSSIIYITSDHIPPLLDDNIHYGLDRYENISLFINDGHAVDVSGKRYYEIPWLIWDELTGLKNARSLSDKDREELYFKLLFESIQSRNH